MDLGIYVTIFLHNSDIHREVIEEQSYDSLCAMKSNRKAIISSEKYSE